MSSHHSDPAWLPSLAYPCCNYSDCSHRHIFLALCEVAEQLGKQAWWPGPWNQSVCQHPAGNGSYESWLSLCWDSCARFKDSSFQRGFVSRAQLFRNPTALPVSVLNLNGPPPSPVPDLGSWARAARGGQAERRGIPRCPESDSGSSERITVAFRSVDLPRTQAAPAQHLCPFHFWRQSRRRRGR